MFGRLHKKGSFCSVSEPWIWLFVYLQWWTTRWEWVILKIILRVMWKMACSCS